MTILKGNELFEYLGYLEGELAKQDITDKESLNYLANLQFKEIIQSEINFLKYINSYGTSPILAISLNGLPSIDSLKPDLEKMCELAEFEESFIDIAKKFKMGIRKKDNEENSQLYNPVSREEWKRKLSNLANENLKSQKGFTVNQTSDGKMEISTREEIYLKGYDQYSKEVPFLIREGKTHYHVIWNRLLSSTIEEKFYLPRTELVLKESLPIQPKKVFENIKRDYNFKRKDYKTYSGRMPLFFWGSWIPKNYSSFLSAGTNSRVDLTKKILITLENSLEREININKLNKNNLELVLSFVQIPFKNAPELTPHEESLPASSTKFTLISPQDTEPIGEIKYILPCKVKKLLSDGYGGLIPDGDKFFLGKIRLLLFGSGIYTGNQFFETQKRLNQIKGR